MKRLVGALLLALLVSSAHAEGSHQYSMEVLQALAINAAILLVLLLVPAIYILIRGKLPRFPWLLVLIVVDGVTVYTAGSYALRLEENVLMSPYSWAALSVPGYLLAMMHMHQARRVPVAGTAHRAIAPEKERA